MELPFIQCARPTLTDEEEGGSCLPCACGTSGTCARADRGRQRGRRGRHCLHARPALLRVYCVDQARPKHVAAVGSHGHGQQLSSPPSDWTQDAAVGYVKLLRKPEGSIMDGAVGNLPSPFSHRGIKREQRCNVLASETGTGAQLLSAAIRPNPFLSAICMKRGLVGRGRLDTGRLKRKRKKVRRGKA